MSEHEVMNQREEARDLMIEGYIEMAEEGLKYAQDAFSLASETLLMYTRWDEEVTEHGSSGSSIDAHPPTI